MTIWHLIRFGSAFAIQTKWNEVLLKIQIITENTEIDQEIDGWRWENNANERQVIIEELSVEEQLTKT
jgi:hypothetical protein